MKDGCKWRLTGVYRESHVDKKVETWRLLRNLHHQIQLPWVCLGDFNEVLHRHEHVGVLERSYAQMSGFRDMLDVCGLADLGYKGNSWTFEKRVAGGSFCRVRLDRALASLDWSSRYPDATLFHLVAAGSDHCPILLRLSGHVERHPIGKKNKLFRYEVMWDTHPDLKPTVHAAWEPNGHNITVGKSEQISRL